MHQAESGMSGDANQSPGIFTVCEAVTARISSVDQTVQSAIQHTVDRQQDW